MINLGEATYKNKIFGNPQPCAICFDGVNDLVDYSYVGLTDWVGWGQDADFSYSMWVKQSALTAQNSALWFESAAPRLMVGTSIRIVYNASLNRILIMIEDPNNGYYARRHFALHDNPSTGITYPQGWIAGTGGADNYGYVHLGVTFDFGGATAADQIKFFWNGVELTSVQGADVADNFGGLSRNVEYLVIGDSGHTGTVPQQPLYGCMDEIYAYAAPLTQTDFTAIHAAGRLGGNPIGGWATAWKFQSGDINDVNNLWTATATGAAVNCTQTPQP
jgi:hypothetical protein